jgi:hypothetical protein
MKFTISLRSGSSFLPFSRQCPSWRELLSPASSSRDAYRLTMRERRVTHVLGRLFLDRGQVGGS